MGFFDLFKSKPVAAAKVEDVSRKKPRKAKITEETIVDQMIVRSKENIKTWREATQSAESVHHPDRNPLMKVFRDIEIDAHLTSLMDTLIIKVQRGDYWICDEKGERNDDDTAKLKAPWVREYVKHFVNATFYGYSLVEFGSIIDDKFVDITLVPRENCIPEKKAIKKNINVTSETVSWIDPPYRNWTVFIDGKNHLGLLWKAAPLVIWKKNVLSAWSQYAELFGMPTRIGWTNINDPTLKKNMTDMLKNMGKASWAVFGKEDKLEFLETRKEDAHKVFDGLADRTNSELSKLILHQTMTTDDGSSRSQAEVHESVLKDLEQSLKEKFEDHFNDDQNGVMRILTLHGILGPNRFFKWDNSEQISLIERFEMVDKLMVNKEVPNSYIQETFDIPVEDKQLEEPIDPKIDPKDIENNFSVIKEVAGYYEETGKTK